MSCEKGLNVKSYFDLLLIWMLIRLMVAFTNDISTLNPSIISSSAFCVQDLLGTTSGGIFQNKMTKAVFFTANASVVIQLTTLSSITFKEIKCLSKERVVLLAQNSSIFQYNMTSGTKTSFDSPWAKQINIIKISGTQQKLIYVLNQSIRIKSFPLTPLSQEMSYTINTTINELKCSTKRNKSLDGYCFFVPINLSSLQFFHISHPQIIYERPIEGIKSLTISQMNERIYVGFETGQIREYSMSKKNVLMFQRQTKISQGNGIVSLVTNQLRGQLLYLNSVYKVGIMNLTSGYEVGRTTQLSSFCSPTTILSLLSRNSIAVFNPSQFSPTIRLLNTQTIITNSSLNISLTNPLAKLCPKQLQYYNTSISQCQPCTKGCSLCDQETGQCLTCQNGYFLTGELCLNCKYASITSEYYSICFKENEITVLTYTTAITPALTSTIHTTYSLLSSSALLFLFLRFINFWSIISLYYFLNIDEIPFFLLQILSKIFNILYGSVFQFFEIDISYINMGVKEKNIDQKMIATKITTDFLAANFQSIVMYIYSLIMICILYDGIKRWFKKINIQLFQNVKLQACLEQFVGLFITLLVSSYLFIEEPNFSNFLQKLNNSLFMILLGIGLVFPFFYMILTLQRVTVKKRIRLIKKSLRKKGLISQSTFKSSQIWESKGNKKIKTEKRLINILSQQETQKFLYCLNCFWSPFLVGFKSPIYFLAFGFFNHFLCLWNAFYAKEWKYNLILGKSIFFLYHLSFVLIKVFPSLYFLFSIIAFSLIIVGGLHELLSAVGQKLYFVFLVLKNKGIIKSNKINIEQKSAQKSQNEDSSAQQKSLHSKISMKEISSQNFQKSSLKNIDTTITNTNVQNSTKKNIKKVKIVDTNQNIVKNIFDNKLSQAFTWNQEKSLQNIDLTNKQSQQPRNKKIKFRVKFSNVQNNTNKIQYKQPIKAKSEKRHEEISNKSSLDQLNFKLAKLNKVQRRALFDHQFGDFGEQKQNNQLGNQTRNKTTKRDKKLVATFSHPTEDIKMKKKVKFLKIDSTMSKLGQFSKTQPQAKILFSIKQT